MTTTLITGATRGLGLETARRLTAAGHTVYLGARDLKRGQEAAQQTGARAIQLDVTDDESVQAAAKLVREEAGTLDVLINNAGISGAWKLAGEYTAPDMETVYATNVFGLVRVTHAFLPLLGTSGHPVIVNVSSTGGSLTRNADPTSVEYKMPVLTYASSKSAVNMITVQYANAFPHMRINAVSPGLTATDFSDIASPGPTPVDFGELGIQSVEEGAEIIIRMATTGHDGPTGGFFEAGGPAPW
ncbi:SDR family NAD(P)-dependent oxidoreductase [Streptomyces sp. NPDC093099]|uniref:SDR family NAD(P)-dependent oxidoreductase n=1 Tax=Streptomyces sp. NPDC093099 TaxID=3366028 RepID=UPI0038227E05